MVCRVMRQSQTTLDFIGVQAENRTGSTHLLRRAYDLRRCGTNGSHRQEGAGGRLTHGDLLGVGRLMPMKRVGE